MSAATERPLDWAEKLAQADQLAREITDLRSQMRELISREAKLRMQAQREREQHEQRQPHADPTDPLLAAAGLAAGDLEPGFQVESLAAVLGISSKRTVRILLALEQLGNVRREGRGALMRWAAVDPDEANARDAARELGHFNADRLAARMHLTAVGARHYIALMLAREQLREEGDGTYSWTKPGPERLVTRRRQTAPPEVEAVRKLPQVKRGEVVELTGRADGASHKPMQDKRKKTSGRRVKRSRTKGYS